MTPANRIRELREERQWSQERLAAAVRTSQQQIQRLEKSRRRLTTEWMNRLSAALGCSPADLLPNAAQASELSPRQKAVLEIWDALDPADQDRLLAVARAFAKPATDEDNGAGKQSSG